MRKSKLPPQFPTNVHIHWSDGACRLWIAMRGVKHTPHVCLTREQCIDLANQLLAQVATNA